MSEQPSSQPPEDPSLPVSHPPDQEPQPAEAREPDESLDEPLLYDEPEAPPETGWQNRLGTRISLAALLGVSLVLLLVAALAAWYLLSSRPPEPGTQIAETPPASLAELGTEFPEMSSVLSDPKLDSVYKDFLRAYEQGGLDAAYELAETRGLLNANGDVRLTLVLYTTDTAPLAAELQSYGVVVTGVSGNEIEIAIPRQLLEQLVTSDDPASLFENLTGLEQIENIRLPFPNVQDQEGIQTESIPVIGADVWHSAGITGKGVKVGVLDLGFDTYPSLLGTDLPEQVTARSFIHGKTAENSGEAHGTAVAEIIHDVAPEAELYFAAYETDVEYRQAIDWLVASGVQIISHSAGSIYGPMDGTGPDAVFVDQIVSNGILWVNSAGNTGYTHYRGTFTDDDGDGYHEFSSGDEMMDFIPNNQAVMALNWDDWGRGLEDFDLYILDANGNEIASSKNIQDGPEDDSAEAIIYSFDESKVYYLAFYASRSSRPAVFDFFMRGGQIEYFTPEGSVTTPGDARRSLTVGATNWSDDKLEDYSSQGPTRDGRLKPEIAAPSGVSSAAFGETWIGTSASAPHVSGAAALVLQAFPNYSPEQVTQYLESHARDLGPTGPDNTTGYGRLAMGEPPALPDPALLTATAQAPTPEASPPPATPQPTATTAPTSSATTPTVTPERVILTTPDPNESAAGTGFLAVTLLLCVALPGLLGLAGIGMVAAVWSVRRPRPGPQGYPARRPPRPRYPTATTGDAWPGAPHPITPPPAPPAQQRPPEPVVRARSESGDCPRCGTAYRSGARFCSTCGLALDPDLFPPEEQAFCTKCGQRLRASSKFCPHCGAVRHQEG